MVGKQHDAEPEIVDRSNDILQLLKIERLDDIAIRIELVTLDDIHVGARAGQDHDGNLGQIRRALDLGQHLAPVLARQVQVEQDQVRSDLIAIGRLLPQHLQGLLAILCNMQTVGELAVLQRDLRQQHVAFVVLDQQQLRGSTKRARYGVNHSEPSWQRLTLNENVEPAPGEDSTDIRPPRLATILLQIANPMPAPEYSLAVCSRLNGSK